MENTEQLNALLKKIPTVDSKDVELVKKIIDRFAEVIDSLYGIQNSQLKLAVHVMLATQLLSIIDKNQRKQFQKIVEKSTESADISKV